MGFVVHKRGQGMYARVSAMLVLGFAVFYGCMELYQSDLMETLPVLVSLRYLTVTWGMAVVGTIFAVLVALVIALTIGFVTQRRRLKGLENKSLRFVDFLIDVEGELRKVAWPSRKQLVSATSVVLITTVLFAIFIFSVDQILHRFMRLAGIL